MFAAETVVADALALHPKARWVFAAWHLRGCVECHRSMDETLAQLAEGYGLSLERFLADLNSLSRSAVAEPPLSDARAAALPPHS